MVRALLNRFLLALRVRRHLLLPGAVVSLGIFIAAHFVVSCTGTRTVVVPPPSIDGATFVGNASCATCHQSITEQFPGNVHARVHASHGKEGLETSCESCHGPGSRHVETGGGTPFARLIVNPGKKPEACLDCHVGVHAQFKLPHHHPVLEGRMNCVDCHDPHGHDSMKAARGPAVSRLDQSCADCHREQSRHFVFEHEAMREGCTTCHQPHGSVNDKLLVQRDANLCLKCHAQMAGAGGSVVIGKTDHSFFLRQGHCSTSGCHTAVHGSNISPKFFH